MLRAADGNIRIVDGDMDTIMAGLACPVSLISHLGIFKEPCNMLYSCAEDEVAARAPYVTDSVKEISEYFQVSPEPLRSVLSLLL